jgi:hypothetical protein
MSYTQDPQYDLFYNYHYTKEHRQSLRPIYSGNKMSFPSYNIITKKKLSVIDKLRYYVYDFLLYIKTRNDE